MDNSMEIKSLRGLWMTLYTSSEIVDSLNRVCSLGGPWANAIYIRRITSLCTREAFWNVGGPESNERGRQSFRERCSVRGFLGVWGTSSGMLDDEWMCVFRGSRGKGSESSVQGKWRLCMSRSFASLSKGCFGLREGCASPDIRQTDEYYARVTHSAD